MISAKMIESKVRAFIRRTQYNGYLASGRWQNKRYEKLAEVGFACEKCGYGKYEGEDLPLDVHHKTYERLGNERMADLEVLCRKCHKKLHGREF